MSRQLAFKADLSNDQVFDLSAKMQQHRQDAMPTIRASLLLLARSSDQVELTDEQDADAFMELLESLNDVIDHEKALVNLLETAQARLLFMLGSWVAKGADQQHGGGGNG